MEALRGFAGSLVDLLFPPKCLACGALDEPFCAACERGIEPAVALTPPAGVRDLRSAGCHEGPLRSAVLQLKFARKVALAAPLGRLLAEELEPVRREWAPDYLAPVPDHWTRRLERGYNQAELLAGAAGRLAGVSVRKPLRRVRPTGRQVGRGAAERAVRLRGAFAPGPGVEIEGRRIVLVDDVWTTGATLAECAEVLRAAGALAVYALTVTHEARIGPQSAGRSGR